MQWCSKCCVTLSCCATVLGIGAGLMDGALRMYQDLLLHVNMVHRLACHVLCCWFSSTVFPPAPSLLLDTRASLHATVAMHIGTIARTAFEYKWRWCSVLPVAT